MIEALLWLLVLVIARLIERTWWSPGAILALVLGVSAMGTAVFAPEYYRSFSANLFLQALVIAAVIGSLIGRSFPGRDRPQQSFVIVRERAFFLTGMASAVVSFSAILSELGVTLANLANPLSIMRAAQAATRMRYTEGFDFPLTYNLANAALVTYAAVLVAHIISTRRIRLHLLVPVLIYTAGNLLITTRAPIISLGLVMAFSAIFARKRSSPRGEFPRLFSVRSSFVLAISAAALAGFFFFLQVLRFGEQSTRTADQIWGHLRRYPWGNLPGFSIWWDGLAPWEDTDHLPGFYTFMGIYDNLGIDARAVGGYTAYIPLTADEMGNIYTAFRGLVHDFGTFGALIFVFLVGILGGMAVAGRAFSSRVSYAVYISVSCFFAYSFIFSLWAYTSFILAMLVTPLALRIFTSKTPPTSLNVERKKRDAVNHLR